MKLDVNEFIDDFGRCMEEGAAGLFVGAGLSIPAGYPSWQAIMKTCLSDLKLSKKFDDMPQLAQHYQDNIPGGRDRLTQLIVDKIQGVPNPTPTRSHELLAQLPVNVLWTTNYDTLLEQSHPGAEFFTDDDQLAGPSPKAAECRIYKMHGTIAPKSHHTTHRPERARIVISKDDYEEYPTTHPRMWALLHAHFLTRTFLLSGLSFTDPNLEHIFRLIRLMKSEGPRPHFAILRKPTDRRDQRPHELKLGELERVGIQTLEIAEYEDIEDILRQLVSRSRPYRLFISGSPIDVNTNGGSISYEEDEIPTKLMSFAKCLGAQIHTTCDRIMAAGGVGAQVGYEMARQLNFRGKYDPECLILVRRYRDEEVDYPNLRIGKLVFTGKDPNDLRQAAFKQVRAMVILGGQRGSMSEYEQALKLHLGIIPVGMTGGTAQQVWGMIERNFDNYLLGGRKVNRQDFDLLNQPNEHAAAQATLRLAQQALYKI
ncbi:SIR2 family protein [Streptomyces canus]|uniref:SIR2 family protein n=1 Tax=Streptomyces canus TaxID=58343 RepID=UPI002781A177|nr:SIR2 family protein [Streptomyces canus]MDQ1068780.1 hypothetical protein [Streptomyces canus]